MRTRNSLPPTWANVAKLGEFPFLATCPQDSSGHKDNRRWNMMGVVFIYANHLLLLQVFNVCMCQLTIAISSV